MQPQSWDPIGAPPVRDVELAISHVSNGTLGNAGFLSVCTGILEIAPPLLMWRFSDPGTLELYFVWIAVDGFSAFSDEWSLKVAKPPAYLPWSKLKILPKIV